MSEHVYDLSKSKKIKEVISDPSDESIRFTNDLEGQFEVRPKGKDLVITVYAQNKGTVNYKKVLGTVTIVDGASFEYIDKKNVATIYSDNNGNNSVYNYVPEYLEYDFSDSKKGVTILGSDYSETFYGGTKADKITTGSDFYSLYHDSEDADIIYGGKGDDQITIDGFGLKQIYVNKGDGNDTVDLNMANVVIPAPAYFTGYVSRTDDIPVQPVGSSLVVDATIGLSDVKTAADPQFTYIKRGADLIINAEHSDGTKESLTLKSYFNMTGTALNTYNYIRGSVKASETSPENYDLIVNGDGFKKKIMPNETLVIAGVPVKELIKMVEKEFQPGVTEMVDGILKVIKIPSSIMNANVFIGTETDNEFLGTNNKDIMLSSGGDNYFETGTKGLSVIASLGNEFGEDIYNVSSFEAGTVIIDKDGKYDLGIGKVDTNDIHMIGIDTGSTLTKGTASASTTIEYLTDTKGVKNITGLDFNGIYKKVMDVVKGGLNLSDKKQVKAINSVISTAAGLIDKFRGVAIVANRDVENDGLYDDLYVTDKNGNKHIISADSQEANTLFIMQNISAFAENMSHKFGMDMGSLIQAVADPSLSPISVAEIEEAIDDGYIDKAFVKKYFKYVKENTKEEIPAHYELNKNAVKEITGGLTDVFTNSYVGTDGDNSFTISHSDAGAVVAAGTGNDTITFKGEIGNTWKDRPDAYNPYNYPVYNIISTLNKAPEPELSLEKKAVIPADNYHDTIVFKNYTKDKDLFAEFENGHQYDIDKREVYGMDFYASKWDKKSSTYGEVHYIIGEDGELDEDGDYVNNTPYSIKGNKFELTVKDKSSTYEISAEQNDTITEDWSKDKSNHYAVVQSAETEIKTGKGKNMIESYGISTVPTKGTNPTLSYTYGGGQDKVISRRESNDTYYAKLTGKTDLVIYDSGDYDNDKLILSNTEKEAKNIRAYFNIDRDSDVSDELNISLISGKLSKSSFDIVEVDEKMIYPHYVVDGLKNGIDFNYNYYNDYGIENIYYGEDETKVNMDAIVSQVKSELAGWFSKYEQYDSTDAAIIADDKNAIKDLVAVYNSVDLTYNPVVS